MKVAQDVPDDTTVLAPAVPVVPSGAVLTGRAARITWVVVVTVGVPLAALVTVLSRSTSIVGLICGAVLALAALTHPRELIAGFPPIAVACQGILKDSTPLIFAGLGLLVAIAVWQVRRRPPIRAPQVWMAVLVCVLVASFVWPATHPTTAYAPPSPRSYFLALILLQGTIVFRPRPRVIATVIAVTGALAASWALLAGQNLGGRLICFTLGPNDLAILLAPPLVAAVGLAWYDRRPWWLLAALPCAVAVMKTVSRGSLVATAAGVAMVLASRWLGRRRLLAALAAAVAAGVVAYNLGLFNVTPLAGRDPTQLELSSSERLAIAEAAVQATLNHPLRGLGYGMFPWYVGHDTVIGMVYYTHDEYLWLASQAGIVAAAAFCALLWLATSSRRVGDLAMLRAVVATYAINLLFIDGDMEYTAALWVSLGVLIAAHLRESHRAPGRHRRTARGPDWLVRRLPDRHPPPATHDRVV